MEPTTTKLPAVIEDWLASQRAAATARAYRAAVTEWLPRLNGRDITDARPRDADDWRQHLNRSGLQPRTVARKLASISSLYDYLEALGIIDRSPFARVRRPKVSNQQGTTVALTAADARRLLAAAEAAGPRTHVAVQVLLATAVRASELLGLDVAQVGVADGSRTIKVKRKGGHSETVPLPDRVAHDVDALIGDRKKGPLFAGDRGPWTYWQLLDAVVHAGRAAGINEQVTPHVCRTTWATLALGSGVPLQDVQAVMGHVSADTTQGYNRARLAMARKVSAVESVDALLREGLNQP